LARNDYMRCRGGELAQVSSIFSDAVPWSAPRPPNKVADQARTNSGPGQKSKLPGSACRYPHQRRLRGCPNVLPLAHWQSCKRPGTSPGFVYSQLGLQTCHFALLTSHPFLLVLRPSTRVFPDPSPSARLRVLPMWLESQLALPNWPQFIVVLPTWAQLLRACQTGLPFFLCPRLVPPRSWRPGSYPFRRPGVLRPQMPSRPDRARWAAGGRASSVSVGPAWLLMLPTWRCYAFSLQPNLSCDPDLEDELQ
jgi:hypothetical protein